MILTQCPYRTPYSGLKVTYHDHRSRLRTYLLPRGTTDYSLGRKRQLVSYRSATGRRSTGSRRTARPHRPVSAAFRFFFRASMGNEPRCPRGNRLGVSLM